MKLLRTLFLLLGLALGTGTAALAQWQWLDKDGRKVFSDKAPPPDVPAKNILRQPGMKGPPPVPVEADATSTASAAAGTPARAASAPRISGKDKELEEKKKQAEAAEADKRKAEEDRVAKMKAENCSRARQSKADFDSGLRIARTNAKGEREFLDEATRAAEVKRLQDIIASDCKTS